MTNKLLNRFTTSSSPSPMLEEHSNNANANDRFSDKKKRKTDGIVSGNARKRDDWKGKREQIGFRTGDLELVTLKQLYMFLKPGKFNGLIEDIIREGLKDAIKQLKNETDPNVFQAALEEAGIQAKQKLFQK